MRTFAAALRFLLMGFLSLGLFVAALHVVDPRTTVGAADTLQRLVRSALG